MLCLMPWPYGQPSVAYNLRPGDTFTLLDLGGVFVLVPRRSEMDSIAEGTALALTERGETLETTLQARREDRER